MEAVNKKAQICSKKSAMKLGGNPEDYLSIHEWFYEPLKWVDGDAYLLFRHHAQGIFEAEKRFGVTIVNSAGKHVPTRLIAEQHVTSEVGFIPTALEIIDKLEIQKWMGYRNKSIIRYAKENRA